MCLSGQYQSAYLDNTSQSTHYKVIQNCTKAQCSALIERGWRRFGTMFFRPVCSDCHKCESLKIDVENFQYSKQARRTIKKASRFQIIVQDPILSNAHLELFKRYHDYMEALRGWDRQQVSPQNYYMSFVQGHGNFGKEVLYFDQNRLIGVDLIDLLDNGISSIYFYHDPEYRSYALGKYSIYHQIEYAKSLGLPWIYLGYYVAECQSLAYKNQYRPYYILQGRPEEDETPEWILADHLTL